MPDIGESYPIKPIWPTRPENQTDRRRRPHKENGDQEQPDEEKKQEQPRERPGDTPHIDDYA
jgi:hypothetical protein